MSVVDYFLNALIRHLQKTQKARSQRKKKKKSSKTSHRLTRTKSKKKLSKSTPRRNSVPKKSKVKRPSQKVSRRFFRTKKKSFIKKKERRIQSKKAAKIRKNPAYTIIKPDKVKKNTKVITQVPKNKTTSKEICIGQITHFFPKIQVVVLKVTHGKLFIGDQIRIKGHGHDFTQNVKSLQIESVDVKAARKGQLVGLKVDKTAKAGDAVFKLIK